MKYLNKNTPTSCVVHWDQLDEKGNIVGGSSSSGSVYAANYAACFSSLFRIVSKNTKTIIVKHPTKNVCYDEPEIKRWIKEITELGFPCYYLGIKDDNIQIKVDVEEQKTKARLCSTLTLIRCLYENYGNYVPNNYFEILDKNKKVDKIEALQNAHKMKAGSSGYEHLGHMLTGSSNGAGNVDRETLTKRLDGDVSPYDAGVPYLNAKWRK